MSVMAKSGNAQMGASSGAINKVMAASGGVTGNVMGTSGAGNLKPTPTAM